MQVIRGLGPIGHRLARVLLHLDVVELPDDTKEGKQKEKRGISKCPTGKHTKDTVHMYYGIATSVCQGRQGR